MAGGDSLSSILVSYEQKQDVPYKWAQGLI